MASITTNKSSLSSPGVVMDEVIKTSLTQKGYFDAIKLCTTLQGSIWSSTHPLTKQSVIIKETNKELHKTGVAHFDGKKYHVQENILKERAILQYLTTSKDAPTSIVKYIGWFADYDHYYLVMENGGTSLFEFVLKTHDYLKYGKLEITEWHKLVQYLFKAMVNTVDYMHKKESANFDISLENMLINDVHIYVDEQDKLQFVMNDNCHPIEMKFCDFGLAEMYKCDDDGKCTFLSRKNAGKTSYKSPEMTAKNVAFSAAANDVWCLGVCLFMMLIGANPMKKADVKDEQYQLIMDGKMMKIIESWGRKRYITNELVHLMSLIFQSEEKRITISELKKHPWLQ